FGAVAQPTSAITQAAADRTMRGSSFMEPICDTRRVELVGPQRQLVASGGSRWVLHACVGRLHHRRLRADVSAVAARYSGDVTAITSRRPTVRATRGE